MFNLTLRDHLHLTFTEIVQRRNAHAQKSQSQARWARRLRGAEALLMAGASAAAAGAAFGHGQVLTIVAASMAGVALILLIINLSFDFDATARAHAAYSSQLWGLRERYRALLSDLHDEALTVTEARLRRDRLIEELRSIHEGAAVIAFEKEQPEPGDDVQDKKITPHPPAVRSA